MVTFVSEEVAKVMTFIVPGSALGRVTEYDDDGLAVIWVVGI